MRGYFDVASKKRSCQVLAVPASLDLHRPQCRIFRGAMWLICQTELPMRLTLGGVMHFSFMGRAVACIKSLHIFVKGDNEMKIRPFIFAPLRGRKHPEDIFESCAHWQLAPSRFCLASVYTALFATSCPVRQSTSPMARRAPRTSIPRSRMARVSVLRWMPSSSAVLPK
jgi:hypothetical protein